MLLFVIVSISLVWMHVSVRRMERAEHPELRAPRDLPEVHSSATSASAGRVLAAQ